MRHIIRGQGIKFLDEQLEIASFRALIGIYSPLIYIEDEKNLNDVLFAFQEYLFKEYNFLKKACNHYEKCDCMEQRIKFIRSSIQEKRFMVPSEILSELDNIKRLKQVIDIQEVSCLPCKKLK